jgi:SAM-dependent methyltransferase
MLRRLMAGMTETSDREQAFWDEHVSSLEEILAEYRRGPDPNTRLMLDLLEPLEGRRVLDFACGAGLTSAWLAERGAIVTGIDISPASITRAREVVAALGFQGEFTVGEIDRGALAGRSFDRVTGRWALHHVDTETVPRALAELLVPGGVGSFHETMGLNPVLRFARSHLMGLPGVIRFGSVDEHPLLQSDIERIRAAFGHAELKVAQLTFIRILDRNVFHHRRARARRLAGAIDDWLLAHGAASWSYHQVVHVSKP